MEDARAIVEDLFRRESARLVAALVRALGPSNVALAEDVVHDALVSAMQAWRFGAPEDPKAWILQVAKRRAIDVLRRERRIEPNEAENTLERAVEAALSEEADAENQLAMMFAICDGDLSAETHVSLILRLLCGLSSAEIARAFLVDVPTIDRRLHRGRARLRERGALREVTTPDEVRARQPSVEQALYLLFNEGYQGSEADDPLHPAMCADALRLAELLLHAPAIDARSVHALAALFCFGASRLSTRLDEDGVLVPLADQDRRRWDRALIDRGVRHLAESAGADRFGRWHLEAGIALEHAIAPSIEATHWGKIVDCYDALLALFSSPVVAMNRALAVAELHGLDAGRRALDAIADDAKLARYSFFWAARADVERRSGRDAKAVTFYRRAIELATTHAERASYERRVSALEN